MTENEPKTLQELIDESRSAVTQNPRRKQRAWQAWREAWNERGSTDSMQPIEERTARTRFERWWSRNHD
jgi:hypothetical protein